MKLVMEAQRYKILRKINLLTARCHTRAPKVWCPLEGCISPLRTLLPSTKDCIVAYFSCLLP